LRIAIITTIKVRDMKYEILHTVKHNN